MNIRNLDNIKIHRAMTLECLDFFSYVDNLPPSENRDKFQTSAACEFPSLDMKISWSPEGDL